MARLRAVTHLQNRLAARDFGCAYVLCGPTLTDGVPAVVEEYLPVTSSGDPHDPAARAGMAGGLAGQIALLREEDGSALVTGRPAWANWDSGAWPEPHVPVFDFTAPEAGFEWLDEVADAMACRLTALDAAPVVGHSDWVWQNVCVRAGRFVAGFDWDSLVFLPESAVVGLAAGAFSQGSPDAPSAVEVDAFIADYETARGAEFGSEREIVAAATWVRCFNARCEVDNRVRRNMASPEGSFLEQLSTEYGRRR